MDNNKTNKLSAVTDRTKDLLSSKRNKMVAFVVLAALVSIILGLIIQSGQGNKVDSYTECITTTGSKSVADNSGTKCTTKDGKVFTNNEAKAVEWRSYKNGPISFNYPLDWTVSDENAPPIYGINSTIYRLSGTNDPALKPTPASATNEALLLNILTVNPSVKLNWGCECTVMATKGFIFRSNNKVAQLLAVDINGNNKADLLILGPQSAKAGDKDVKRFFDFSDKYQLALQSNVADKLQTLSTDPQYEVEDARAFLNSDSVVELVGVLGGLNLK